MSDARDAAWAALDEAAIAWVAKRGKMDAVALSVAAKAWAKADASEASPRREASGARSAVAGDGWTFRFGRNSGKRPDEVDVADLRWYERVFLESLDNPEKARFRDNNQRALDVVRAELRRRGEAGDW